MTGAPTGEPGNLPAEPNSFIGRERDLRELALLLDGVRLLTLCGPGGIGKTRLALRLALQIRPRYPDGVWLVQLGDATRQAQVARRVGAVLGIREEPGRPLTETLAATLRGRRLLLILDTCEHLADPCAALAQHLLTRCPRLNMIATSREPLRVPGETLWRVPPLELPRLEASDLGLPGPDVPTVTHPAGSSAPGGEAVALFAVRAAAARTGFALTADNAESVTRLCRLLDGVPLALELAAARVRALSVEQIAARLGDQFQLLTSSDTTAPPRQQTLRATVDWSYEQLSPPEQLLLRRVSVFSGWTLEMAEEVCSGDGLASRDIPALLGSLVDKSLVIADYGTGGTARYSLLDTMRRYAAHLLSESGEQAAVRERHRDCMLGLAESFVATGFLRGDPSWPQRLAIYRGALAESPNFMASLSLSLERGDAVPGLRLCSALTYIWIARGNPAPGARWFDLFFTLPGDIDPAVHGQALVHRGELAFEQHDDVKADDCERVALGPGHSVTGRWRATALRVLAQVRLRSGEGAAALTLADEAIEAASEARDDWERGLSLAAKGAILASRGAAREAQRNYQEAIEVLAANNGWGMARTRYGLGYLAQARGDLRSAMEHFRAALAIFREIGAPREVARCLAGIGRVALAEHDLLVCRESLAESLRLSLDGGSRPPVASCLEAFADLAVASGDLRRAIRITGAAMELRGASARPAAQAAGGRRDRVLDTARRRLGAAAVEALLAEGRAMTVHDASAHALEIDPAASPARGSGGPRAEPADLPVAVSQPPSALTPRELQIATLVGRGMTNRAIAGELVISQATVARHIANMLLKLGFSSRAQIAAWTASQAPPSAHAS